MQERVKSEVELVREKYPNLRCGEEPDWVLIPDYPLPKGRYNKEQTNLLFSIPPGYPLTAPDNFFVDSDLRLADGTQAPAFNVGSNSSSGNSPIPGDWGWFSWHPVTWRVSATIEGGDNLLTFLRGASLCLRGEEWQ